MDGAALKTTILQSLTQLHGEVGAAVLADVLAFDSSTARALIRTTAGCVPGGGRWGAGIGGSSRGRSEAVKLRSALTMITSAGKRPCAVRVVASSPFLASMALPDRR